MNKFFPISWLISFLLLWVLLAISAFFVWSRDADRAAMLSAEAAGLPEWTGNPLVLRGAQMFYDNYQRGDIRHSRNLDKWASDSPPPLKSIRRAQASSDSVNTPFPPVNLPAVLRGEIAANLLRYLNTLGDMPGPLARGHRGLADNCFYCHFFEAGTVENSCLPCHRALSRKTMTGKGYHARLTERQCSECHREHAGDKQVFVDWRGFDHDQTEYPLRGFHVFADCNFCHLSAAPNPSDQVIALANHPRDGLRYSINKDVSDCRSCHPDPHKPSLGADCLACHPLHLRWWQ